jgi:hypothetical protein
MITLHEDGGTSKMVVTSNKNPIPTMVIHSISKVNQTKFPKTLFWHTIVAKERVFRLKGALA